jgi:leucyl-tRNA synthetase
MLKKIFPNKDIRTLEELKEFYRYTDEYVGRIEKNGLVAWEVARVTPGIVPVLEKDLPVLLPEKVRFGEGNPLATNEKFVFTRCPQCGGKGRRETDTMDTFFDSSWYYLRYCDAQNEKEPFDKSKVEYWMPIDFYTGGAEHACMHLIYARFFCKVLRDLGFLKINEPFPKLFNQGMVHGEDGFVMSKSRGNVVDPLDITKKYGTDALRIFLVSIASPDKDFAWSSKGIEGSWKFLIKVWNYFKKAKIGRSSKKLEHKINLAIKEITSSIENIQYNLAVIKLRALFDVIEDEKEAARCDLEVFVKLLSLFCPHTAEELWEKLGNKGFVSLEKWPGAEESKIDMHIEEAEKAIEKTVEDILNILKIVKEKQGKEVKRVYLYVLPMEKEEYNAEILSKRVGKEVQVFGVNDRKKHDPEGRAAKAKPGKPGIYAE